MALASTYIAQTELELVRSQAPMSTPVLSGLLRCLVLSGSDRSGSDRRAQMFRSVAKSESWQVEVCHDVQDFLRSVFQLEAPLTIVDLPNPETAAYEELRKATVQACGLSRSLLVVCGAKSDIEEERWARQLGVWTYLPGLGDAKGLRLVFAEAKKAIAKQSSAYLEACEYR